MLVIHPEECIDCGVCEPECPVEAIKADTEPGAEKWLKLNADYATTQTARLKIHRRQKNAMDIIQRASFATCNARGLTFMNCRARGS